MRYMVNEPIVSVVLLKAFLLLWPGVRQNPVLYSLFPYFSGLSIFFFFILLAHPVRDLRDCTIRIFLRSFLSLAVWERMGWLHCRWLEFGGIR